MRTLGGCKRNNPADVDVVRRKPIVSTARKENRRAGPSADVVVLIDNTNITSAVDASAAVNLNQSPNRE